MVDWEQLVLPGDRLVRRGGRRYAAMMIGAAACVSISGCSTPAVPPGSSIANVSSSAQAPAFSGPFAAEYRNAWEGSANEFVQGVLADEQISDREWAEVAERMTVCFESKQVHFDGYAADGAYSITPRDAEMPVDSLNDVADDCEVESGHRWVGLLRGAERMNPDNRDVYEIMAECLTEVGTVAPGYTAEEYRRDSESGLVPFLDPTTGEKQLTECGNDPLQLGLER